MAGSSRAAPRHDSPRPPRRLVLCLAVAAWRQTRLWGDEGLLFRHATRVVAGNAAAHSQLGSILAARGDLAGAEEQFLLSLQADAGFSGSHANYAFLLYRQGRIAEAREHAARAMAISPGPGTRFKLPELLAAIDQAEAVAARRTAELRFREGVRLAGEGRDAEAVAEFESVLAADPGHAAALNNLGALYARAATGERPLAAPPPRRRGTAGVRGGPIQPRQGARRCGPAGGGRGRLPRGAAAQAGLGGDRGESRRGTRAAGAARRRVRELPAGPRDRTGKPRRDGWARPAWGIPPRSLKGRLTTGAGRPGC